MYGPSSARAIHRYGSPFIIMPAGDAESTINQRGEKLLQGKAAKHNHKDTFVVIIIQSLLIRYVFNEPRQNK